MKTILTSLIVLIIICFFMCSEKTNLTSTHSSMWNTIISNTTQRLNSVTYNDNKFIAVGNESTILLSNDGNLWSTVYSDTTGYLTSVTFGNGKYVAVGSNGIIYVSTDGKVWTKINSNTTMPLNSIIYYNNMFICVGNGGIVLKSSDAIDWSLSTIDSNPNLIHIIHSNNNFIISGYTWGDSVNRYNNKLFTSTDGTTWSQLEINSSRESFTTCYGKDQFISVGDYGTILSSNDGNDWSIVSIDTSKVFFSVSFLNDCYFILGITGDIKHKEGFYVSFNSITLILSSTDGVNWSEILNEDLESNGALNPFLLSITYGNGMYIAVGVGGLILSKKESSL